MFSTIKEEIDVVFERDPAARSVLETVFTCPGFQAIVLHRLNHWLWNKNLYFIARLMAHFARFITGIEIHPGAKIGRRFFIDHGMGIVIGETSEVGDDVSIYHGVTLRRHHLEQRQTPPDIWEIMSSLALARKVLGPITLGAGTRVGCNAVVVKDTPECATVVGVPGQIIVKRNRR